MLIPANLEILPPADDYIFKAMLTHPNAEPALKDLISAAINHNVISVNIRNNELNVTDTEEKNERFDVNCVIDTGDQVEVEMQGSRLEEAMGGRLNFINKYIYYLTDLHSSQKSKGVNYYELVRTYQITFSAYTVFPEYDDYLSLINLRRSDGGLISDQVNMLIIELSKLGNLLKKPVEEMTSLEMWSAFIKYIPDPKHRELINKLIDKREAMAVAAEVLTTISKDEHERAKLRSQKKFEMDMYSNIHTAEYRGKLAGRAEGRAEALAAAIPFLKKKGMSAEDIAEFMSLTVNEALEHYKTEP